MLKQYEKGAGNNMATVIEDIIKAQSHQRNEFLKKQEERIIQLRNFEKQKRLGRYVQQKQIIRKLQKAGILDKNGELSTPYRHDDE